jgi:hypothetical protein
MAISHDPRGHASASAPILRRDWLGTALWGVSFGAASCFLVLVALLAALA